MANRSNAPGTMEFNTRNMQVTISREVHPEIRSHIDRAVSRITEIGGMALQKLPLQHTRQMPLLHSETIRQKFSEKTKKGLIINTHALEELEQQLNEVVCTDPPAVQVQDPELPFRITDNDLLVTDIVETNEIRIDRCNVLRGITEVIRTRKLCVKDIDAILYPIDPILPIARVNRRVLGNMSPEPLNYLYDLTLPTESYVDSAEIYSTDNSIIPPAFRLGKICVSVTYKHSPDVTQLAEYMPGVAFDGVKKVNNSEEYLEYA